MAHSIKARQEHMTYTNIKDPYHRIREHQCRLRVELYPRDSGQYQFNLFTVNNFTPVCGFITGNNNNIKLPIRLKLGLSGY